MGKPEPLDLLTSNAGELEELLTDGQLTSADLLDQILAQIERENRAGLGLRAIISVAPRDLILSKAAELDKERSNGEIRGPLHGLPLLVKDAFATHHDLGMPSTAGSFALLNARPAKSATVVERLLEQGMIIVGKTNMNEFCDWKSIKTMNGLSPVGGQTISAYVPGGIAPGDGKMGHSNPCGSSTGSAVGASAGFSPVALGTETEGSLVQPATRAALFAIKPTIGNTELDGVWPLSARFDSVGAMAKSVKDLAIVTEFLLTPEARSSLPLQGFLKFLDKSFDGLKIGFVDPNDWKFAPEACPQIEAVVQQLNDAYRAAMEKIEANGGLATYPVVLPSLSELRLGEESASPIIIRYEHRDNVKRYLNALEYSEVRTMEDIIEFNEKHSDLELPPEYPDQTRLLGSVNDRPSEEQYKAAIEHLKLVAQGGVNAAMNHHNVDLLVIPMDSFIPTLAAAAGCPIATMPLGLLEYNGRPFGLGLMAKQGREDQMFKFMSAFEVVFPKREIPPQVVHTKGKGSRAATRRI